MSGDLALIPDQKFIRRFIIFLWGKKPSETSVEVFGWEDCQLLGICWVYAKSQPKKIQMLGIQPNHCWCVYVGYIPTPLRLKNQWFASTFIILQEHHDFHDFFKILRKLEHYFPQQYSQSTARMVKIDLFRHAKRDDSGISLGDPHVFRQMMKPSPNLPALRTRLWIVPKKTRKD